MLGFFIFYSIIIFLINTLWDGIGNISSQNYDKVLIFYWTSKFMKISCAKVQFIVNNPMYMVRYLFFFHCQKMISSILCLLIRWFFFFEFNVRIYQQEIVRIERKKRRLVVENNLMYSKYIDKISGIRVSLLHVDLSANWFYLKFLSNYWYLNTIVQHLFGIIYL